MHDGLLVVLEDLHWVDRDSVRLLAHVAGGLAASRALVLVTYRSTERGGGSLAELDALPTVGVSHWAGFRSRRCMRC